jgi:hypothetical protein
VVEFKRVHNQVRLQARNTDMAATPGTPEARAVADSYSHSLLGATPVASQPHPDRKSVLIEANPLFLTDMPASACCCSVACARATGWTAQLGHHRGARLRRGDGRRDAEPLFTGSVAAHRRVRHRGAPVPSSRASCPTRAACSSAALLARAAARAADGPRRADPRMGLFSTTVLDFSATTSHAARKRFVNRWRLEKKDPAAELSEPVKPITFWIDRNVPLAYRETVRAAILEWNKAFEKIGLRDAIVVEQQADDAKFDTLDFGYASVRWMMNASPAFAAIGPATSTRAAARSWTPTSPSRA